jgi:hypothetical protein
MRRIVFEVVGREEELASVAAFVDEVRDEPAALVLEAARHSMLATATRALRKWLVVTCVVGQMRGCSRSRG